MIERGICGRDTNLYLGFSNFLSILLYEFKHEFKVCFPLVINFGKHVFIGFGNQTKETWKEADHLLFCLFFLRKLTGQKK